MMKMTKYRCLFDGSLTGTSSFRRSTYTPACETQTRTRAGAQRCRRCFPTSPGCSAMRWTSCGNLAARANEATCRIPANPQSGSILRMRLSAIGQPWSISTGIPGWPRLRSRPSVRGSQQKPGPRCPTHYSTGLRSSLRRRTTSSPVAGDSGGCWSTMIGGCGRSRPSARRCGLWWPWRRDSIMTGSYGLSARYSLDLRATCTGRTSRRNAGSGYRKGRSGYG